MVYALAEWSTDRPLTSFSAKLVSRSEVVSVTVRPVNSQLVEIENSPDGKFKAGKVLHLYNKANEEMAELIILPHPVERRSETWTEKYYNKWYPKEEPKDDIKPQNPHPNYPCPGDNRIVDFGNTDEWLQCAGWVVIFLMGTICFFAMLASCSDPEAFSRNRNSDNYDQISPLPVHQRWERDDQ